MPNLDKTSVNHTPWEGFEHAMVRDIAWLLSSPSLLSVDAHNQIAPQLAPFNQPLAGATIAWLHALENDPTLFGTLSRSNFRRLGLYAEALFAFICQQPTSFHSLAVIARNLQIEKQGRTFGELDFLLSQGKTKINHLEMAVKFYLYHPETGTNPAQQKETHAAANRLIGPNRKDRLDLKLKRMTEHQLPIVQTPEAKNAFEKNGLSLDGNPIDSHLLINGRIFLPAQKEQLTASQPTTAPHIAIENTPLSAFVNTQISTGGWLYQSEFAEHTKNEHANEKWIVLRKLDWLAGPKADNHLFTKALTPEEIIRKIQIGGDLDFTPPMLLQKLEQIRLPEKNTYQIIKKEQLMLVDDRWPNHL